MLRTMCIAGSLIASEPCLAASGLGLEWSAVASAFTEAAARAHADRPLAPMLCIGDFPSSCRWDAGGGVDVRAEKDGAGQLRQIEAGWSNTRAASDASSAARFRATCATIAALAQPAWSSAQVARVVARTMVVRPSRRDSVDQETSLPGLKLYGSRNTPDPQMRDRPDEAFLQCGAVAD